MKRIFMPTRSGSDWQPLLARSSVMEEGILGDDHGCIMGGGGWDVASYRWGKIQLFACHE
jgi:hypothetical protein